MTEFDDFRDGLQRDGLEATRSKLSQRVWNTKRHGWATDWVKEQEAAIAGKHQAESLAEARGTKIATWVAAIAAVLAALFSALTYFR